ncbi:hypothetical protein EHQ53_03765 [Leptospira langatensis]|uniref:NHL repeat protein n=1 Tax=Leptospira langatensis TaxID=2484983 RepID=A0A5F1ZY92_9LEPT|nr:hypothetical protein [Leptospira langatensis]TGK04276.1 hypothetical protein EHO57_03995 [Leptospira langatensis]TGL43756.1 hypothetical protein EHQ53_03765 [Leptospira langatensis]
MLGLLLLDSNSSGGGSKGFVTGQAASVAIGQNNFTTGVENNDGSGTTIAAAGVSLSSVGNACSSVGPRGASLYANGVLFVPDTGNCRTLAFNSVPSSNYPTANFVIGQADGTSYASVASATVSVKPVDIATDGTKLLIGDQSANRVLVYNTFPTASNASADVVIGQSNSTSTTTGTTSQSTFRLHAGGLTVSSGGKVLVSDNTRCGVLIWNSIPTANATNANLVLAKTNFTNVFAGYDLASCLNNVGVWTNGTKVLVADTGNHRVLVWNSFPTSNGQSANLVLGTTSTTSPASGSGNNLMNGPTFVTSDGTRIFVTDSGNNRVLIWNSWPTTSGAAADAVLGQSGFSGTSANTTATGLSNPQGVALINSNQLIVTDTGNYRHLIYNAQ